MSLAKSIDLTAFPIVRLDQIPILDDDTLMKAKTEVDVMLNDLGESNPKLSTYLRKQNEVMESEMNHRNAAKRIEQLLTGAISILNKPSYDTELHSTSTQAAPLSKPSSTESNHPLGLTTKPVHSIIAVNQETTSMEKARIQLPKKSDLEIPSSSNRISTSAPSKTTDALDLSLRRSASSNLESLPNASRREFNRTTEVSSPVSAITSRSEKTRRSNSLSNNTNIPSQESMDVFNRNFGKEFIVPAIVKKRRFYPKKKPTESPEEIREKERSDRRKLAMERLVKRREEQEARRLQMKEKMRKEKIKKAEAKKAAIAGASDDSESESVSGGDEEKVVVDEDMVAAVQSVHKLEASARKPAIPKPIPKDQSISIKQTIANPRISTIKSQSGVRASSTERTRPNLQSSQSIKERSGEDSEEAAKRISSRKSRASGAATNGEETAQVLPSSSAVNTSVSLDRKHSTKSLIMRGDDSDGETTAPRAVNERDSADNSPQIMTNSNEISFLDTCNSEASMDTVGLTKGASSEELRGEQSMDVVAQKVSTQTEEALLSSIEPPSFASKNLAALSTIRKLKEAKAKSSSTSLIEIIKETQLISAGIESNSISNGDNDVESYEKRTAYDTAAVKVVEQSEASPCEAARDRRECSSSQESSRPRSSSRKSSPAEEEEKQRTILLSNLRDTCDYQSLLPENPQLEGSQIPLLERFDDTIMFNFGPEDLPGLRAFGLKRSENRRGMKFEVDLTEYTERRFSSDNAKVFDFRAGVRRLIPNGLVLLAKECKSLLKGEVLVDSEEIFVAAWLDTIAVFDSQCDESNEEVYFKEVIVCGNGYAVCKKLESLLKHYFLKADGISNHLVITDESNETAPVPLTREPPKSARRPRTPADVSHAVARPRTATATANATANGTATPSKEKESHLSESAAALERFVDEELKRQENADDDGEKTLAGKVANLRLEEQAPGLGPTVLPAIIPAPVPMSVSVSVPVPVSAPMSVAVSGVAGSEAAKATLSSAGGNKAGVKREDGLNDPSREAVPSKDDCNLLDFYPTFASIFPVSQSLSTNRDDSAYARTLVESMHMQAKMYEEWVDVMSDYSTVFCADISAENSELGAIINGKTAMERSEEVYKGGSRSLHYRVKSSRSEVFNIVSENISNYLPQWQSLPAGLGLGLSWNLLWTWSKPRINMSHLLIWQRVNHFEDSKQLTRKDLLKKNLQRFTDMSVKAAAEFEIMPQTFLLPHEYTAFVKAFTEIEAAKTSSSSSQYDTGREGHREPLLNYWILKPVGLSRGRGIKVIKDLGDLSYSQSSVVQKYVERPLCLSNFKFDLRIYVVVTSFKPLEAFVYLDGFARVSTTQYSLDPKLVGNNFIHLTNSSIQKKNVQGAGKDNPLNDVKDDPDVGGSKIALLGPNGLWKRLELFNIDSAALWRSICLLIVKSLVVADEKIANQPCCFELFGYDVLVDESLRPWLLEVNASPSLARENALDHRVKNALICDIVRLLDVAPYDRAALARILRRRLTNIAKNRYLHGRNDPDLESDLREILGDYRPRKFGELPQHLGQFERLCPDTKYHSHVLKLKKKIIRSADDD